MRYLSVCAGIDAASVAWGPLGWTQAAVAEIDPFACHVLAQRFGASRPLCMPDPEEPGLDMLERKFRRQSIRSIKSLRAAGGEGLQNFGDLTQFERWPDATFDLLVGGTPCQSFSVAGLRGGLDDARGNLAVNYAEVARRYRPRWLVWENVPGVFSSGGGRDFGALLGLLSGRKITVPVGGWRSGGIVPGIAGAYGLAWRVLDAQFVRTRSHPRAVPQRRRRVILVGYLGDYRRAAAVLFDREGLSGNPPPRREPGQKTAGTISASVGQRRGVSDPDRGDLIAEPAQPFDVANCLTRRMEKGINTTLDEGQTPVVAFTCKDYGNDSTENVAPTLRAMEYRSSHANGGGQLAVAFDTRNGLQDNGSLAPSAISPTLQSKDHETALVVYPEPIAFDARQSDVVVYGGSAGPLDTDGYSQALAFDTTQITNKDNRIQPRPGDPCHPLSAHSHPPAIAFDMRGRAGGAQFEGPHDTANIRAASGGSSRSYVAQSFKPSHYTRGKDGALADISPPLSADADKGDQEALLLMGSPQLAVRRLTPRECERLQGFPDDFTLIHYRGAPAADGPRYRALGNSMATNVMRWVGERIEMVEAIK